MAKILLIGDVHLKITRFDLCKSFLNWLNLVIEQEKPDLVINLGDSFDSHAVLRSELMEEFKQHVLKVVNFGTPYYYILGNHDFYKPNSSRYHALQPFKELHPLFTVVESPIDVDNMTLVPYQVDLNTFPKITKDICIAHQTFIGADYGFKRADAGVNADDISADIIISGHVHGKQQFGKVYYPGTPYSQSIDDVNQVKGISILDSEKYTFKFVECPLPKWKGIKLELTQDYLINDLHTELESTLNKVDHWIVDIVGPKAEIASYLGSKPFLKLKKGVNLRTRMLVNDKEKERTQIKAIKPEDIIAEYVEKVYKGSLDKATIKQVSTQLLSQVRST
jgi:DNA repair exonuclease SbcCD nuclease subunit